MKDDTTNDVVLSIQDRPAIRVMLREAMEEYRRRTGEKMTYERLSQITNLSRSTLESLASRETYNTRLSTIAKLCSALKCKPGEILEFLESDTDHEN